MTTLHFQTRRVPLDESQKVRAMAVSVHEDKPVGSSVISRPGDE